MTFSILWSTTQDINVNYYSAGKQDCFAFSYFRILLEDDVNNFQIKYLELLIPFPKTGIILLKFTEKEINH